VARSYLTSEPESLIDDSGTVLWSFIRGEQQEFPVVIKFLDDCTTETGYEFTAIVIEAENIIGQEEPPKVLQEGGVRHELDVRQLIQMGNWDSAQAYNSGEAVYYEGKHYYLFHGVARTSSVTPNVDPRWVLTTLNTVFIRFPSDLGADWAVRPKIGWSTYGFFELSVQEPEGYDFRRQWKPVRGMVQLLYSPVLYPVDP
jgi:hypothetical protein